VQGSITPSQGDYYIAINADTDPNTDVNSGFSEVPGEPMASEAQLGTFTRWDQDFIYGFDTLGQPGNFVYSYKVLSGISGGGTTARFVPIILNPNDFTFIPDGSANGGNSNALMITLPIASLSTRGSTVAGGGVVTTPPATQIYVNYITTDTSHTPTDELGCCGTNSSGYQLIVSLTQATTYLSQLTTPVGKSGGPTNPNLYITGGEIIVNPPTP